MKLYSTSYASPGQRPLVHKRTPLILLCTSHTAAVRFCLQWGGHCVGVTCGVRTQPLVPMGAADELYGSCSLVHQLMLRLRLSRCNLCVRQMPL